MAKSLGEGGSIAAGSLRLRAEQVSHLRGAPVVGRSDRQGHRIREEVMEMAATIKGKVKVVKK